jgi:choline dehydrogenase-like flavoprotein
MLTSLSEAATRNYDYIICGEFLHPDVPARLVLAARLTEDTNTSVLVLEAGEAKIDDPTIRS